MDMTDSCACGQIRRTRRQDTVDALIKALNDESYDVRYAAAAALGTIGDPRAVEPLLAVLREHATRPPNKNGVSLEVQSLAFAATHSLGKMGVRVPIEQLVPLCCDHNLVRLRNTGSVDGLIEATSR